MTFKEIRKEFKENVRKVRAAGGVLPAAMCKRDDYYTGTFKVKYAYPIVTKLRKKSI